MNEWSVHIILKKKINVYLCKKTSLKDLILQQGKPIYTDSEFAGQLYKTEPAKVSSNSTWLSSVCDSNNKVTSPSHCLSLLTHNVKQSTISYALSANKCDGTGDRYSFTLQKEERVCGPFQQMTNVCHLHRIILAGYLAVHGS